MALAMSPTFVEQLGRMVCATGKASGTQDNPNCSTDVELIASATPPLLPRDAPLLAAGCHPDGGLGATAGDRPLRIVNSSIPLPNHNPKKQKTLTTTKH